MRNTAILLSFLVALVAGGMAGAAASLLLGAPRPDSRGLPAVATAAPDTQGELAARIDTLVEENRALRERVATLEERPVSSPAEPVDVPVVRDEPVSREDLEAPGEELPGQLGRTEVGMHGDSTRSHVGAADASTAPGDDEGVARMLAEQEEHLARIDGDMAKIEGWLVLSEYQSDAMRASLLVHYEREAELRRLWEGGGDRDLLAQRKEADRESFRSELERFLDPGQLARYWTGVMERAK